MLQPLITLAACSTVFAISQISPACATVDGSISSTSLATNSPSSLVIAQVSDKTPSTVGGTVTPVNNKQSVLIWQLMLAIAAAGATGGLLNALISDSGFSLPHTEEATNKAKVFVPGFIGNILTGAVAGFLSWGLYGPSATMAVVGQPSVNEMPPQVFHLKLSEVAGAVVIGLGGARWLSNEVDKKILTVATAEAARARSSPEASQQLGTASPFQALDIAKSLNAKPLDNLDSQPSQKAENSLGFTQSSLKKGGWED